ncbi:glycosyl transferase [Rhizobium sp. AAP43]|nr:glycosyl transferase [Rhizobium sp. AAP43]
MTSLAAPPRHAPKVPDAPVVGGTPQKPLRVAIVHYWLVSMRGGEKVIEELCQLFPQADIFTLVCDETRLSARLRQHRITTSFLQKIPGARRHYTKMLPLMPFALEHFDLQDYDLVISSESGPAKAIVTRPDALHVCYCHSPMRYIWDQFHLYRKGLPWIGRVMMSLTAPILRVWDVTTAARVDTFVANSAYIGSRIRRFYNRDATVIHPPVAVDDFKLGTGQGEFYLYAGQLTGYKRADLAVRACTESGRQLVVIGEGEQTAHLRAIAGPSVTFLGHQPFPVLAEHLSRCRALLFPGTEDFGILPVEAMASGRPVIAFDAGGARETVSSPDVGLRFAEQTVEGMLEAINAFEARESEFDPAVIRRHAERFSSEVFRSRFRTLVEDLLTSRAMPGVDTQTGSSA